MHFGHRPWRRTGAHRGRQHLHPGRTRPLVRPMGEGDRVSGLRATGGAELPFWNTTRVASRQPLTPTAYAILGLLSFGRELTGYEVKQSADDSLRFFYTAPAMSQIYTEL